MTVLENLQMGAVAATASDVATELARAFELFPVLAERRTQRGGTLSGGEQADAGDRARPDGAAPSPAPRRTLARPGADDRQADLQVIGAINRERGTTVLLVEQNAYHALRLAHRGYVMAQGAS